MIRPAPALTHDWIWQAIDALASRQNLTASGLAKLAGLDATAFNRSRRFSQDGRPRWPSTESIAKILDITQTSLDEFAELANNSPEPKNEPAALLDGVPVLGEIRNAAVTQGAGRIGLERATKFALLVADGSLEPVYSRGNTLIVSAAEPLRAGDRVIVKPSGLQPVPRLLTRDSGQQIELASLQRKPERLQLQRHAIDWIARIMWVRQ